MVQQTEDARKRRSLRRYVDAKERCVWQRRRRSSQLSLFVSVQARRNHDHEHGKINLRRVAKCHL